MRKNKNLTKEEKAAVSRKNGALSHGPCTYNGKLISRMNGLRHGMQARTIGVLPGESAEEINNLHNFYMMYYRPASPAARHLTERCFQAELMSLRCDRAQLAIAGHQLDRAGELFDQSRAKMVESQYDLLADDPPAAVAGLETTGAGCRKLIDGLERAATALLTLGYLRPGACSLLVRLFGCFPEVERLRDSVLAYSLTLENLYCQPGSAAADQIATLLRPEFLPPALAGGGRRSVDTTPAACRDRLKQSIDQRLAWLHAREEDLQTGQDVRQRSQVVDPNTLIADPTEANRFFRYFAESRSTYVRCYNALEAALKADAARADSEESADSDGSSDPATGSTEGPATSASPAAAGGPSDATPEPPVGCETPTDSAPAPTIFRLQAAGESPEPSSGEPAEPVSRSEPDVPSSGTAEPSVATTAYVAPAGPVETGGEPSVPMPDAAGEPPDSPSEGNFLVRRSAELMRLLGPEMAARLRPDGGPWPAAPPGGEGSGS
jgi:hypothetical protein